MIVFKDLCALIPHLLILLSFVFQEQFNHFSDVCTPFIVSISILYIGYVNNILPEVKHCSFMVAVTIRGLRTRPITLLIPSWTKLATLYERIEHQFPEVKLDVYYFTIGRHILDMKSSSITLACLGFDDIVTIFAHLRVRGGSRLPLEQSCGDVEHVEESEVIDLTACDGNIKITPRISVHKIEYLTTVPECWKIPRADEERVAYIIDLRDNPPECVMNGQKSMDAFIKQECQDSWRGSTGSIKNPARVFPLDDLSLDGIECRRSNLYCFGAYICNFSSSGFLRGFQRWDEHRQTRTDNLLASEQNRRKLESTSTVGRTISFFRGIISERCDALLPTGDICNDVPSLRSFRDQFNVKQSFIGCSNWHPTHKQHNVNHYSCSIPHANGVSLEILGKLFSGSDLYDYTRPGSISNDIRGLLNGCTNIVHPASVPPSNECSYIHLAAGKQEKGRLFRIGCDAKLNIFVPVDSSDFRAVVIPERGSAHSHPTFRPRKVPFAVKQEYRKCIQACGTLSATMLKVDTATSTRSILGGKLPQEPHGSLVNNRKRRDLVYEERRKEFPKGVHIEGVRHEREKERNGPTSERYIRSINEFGDGSHVIITLNEYLVGFMLDAIWIMVDTTFKVVHGDTNEFKVVIWVPSLHRSVVVGRVWMNCATREAFRNCWIGLFNEVKKVTGRELNFQIFCPNSPLLGAIGDAEGAQAQGFGDMVLALSLNKPEKTNIILSDSDSVLLRLWKTCDVHFKRGIEKLKPYITETDSKFLLSFLKRDTDESIQEYKEFCTKLGKKNKHVKDWWSHKLSYPWLLPSLNRHLSKMPPSHFDLLPSSTNIVESSHANDNRITSTNHPLLQAILLEKKRDSDAATVLRASLDSGILINTFNSDKNRFAMQAKVNARTHKKSASVSAEKEEKAAIRAEIKRLNTLLKGKDSSSKPSTSTALRGSLNSGSEISTFAPSASTPVTFPFTLDKNDNFDFTFQY